MLAARKVALDRNSSVNQLVREYLTGLVRQTDREQTALANIEQLFKETRLQIGRRKWTRQDLHER